MKNQTEIKANPALLIELAGIRLEGVGKVTKEQLAERLNGRQYGSEITREEEKLAKESGLVVIFGASDDLCEMCGAIYDEFDCYDGGDIECEEYPGKLRAVWCPESGGSWGYKTDLPHAGFSIYEDDTLYCVGIVVDLEECKAKDSEARNGWISVNDRLPPKGCDMLVCDYDDYAGVGYFDGTKWNIDGFEMSTPPVSHWQPLPEPPKRSDKS